jgi:segregation and condensation protein A
MPPMPLQEDYQVALDHFHGPMDLLLYLIRRAEVAVEDIPIAAITDQYLAFLKQIEDIDVEMAGEFLVMAATLIEIKSRVLMPVEDRGEAEAGDGERQCREAIDPRQELVQQLLAYQTFRLAADDLDRRRREFAQRFPAVPSRVKRLEEPDDEAADPIELELDDVHALDLSEAYECIAASIDFAKMGEHRVEIDDTPIALHQDDLLDRLTRSPDRSLHLQEAFEGQEPPQRIGLFLAALELVRLRRIIVRQDEIDQEIVLALSEVSAEATP